MQYHHQRQSEDEEIMATKQRNYSVVMKLQAVEIAKKTSKEAVLDYSNSMFIVFVGVLGLY